MNQSSIHTDQKSKSAETRPNYFEVHGFKIPMTPDGRRIWSPKFKKFVIEKISKGEFKTKDIAKRCKVHTSIIQQWRNDIQTYASEDFDRKELYPPLEVLGFTIPRMNNGKRIWPPELKRLVIEKLQSKEMTAVEIALACQVGSSVIYQWKLEIEAKAKKEVASGELKPNSRLFAEIVNLGMTEQGENAMGQGIFLRV